MSKVVKLNHRLAKELSDLKPDGIASSIPVGIFDMEKVPFKTLPRYRIVTENVFAFDLPKSEFLSWQEFINYLSRYAKGVYSDPLEIEEFIEEQTEKAIIERDDITGDYGWRFNGEVNVKNAKLCGFGVLKTLSGRRYMFQTGLGMDLPSQIVAYQALTYGIVEEKYLKLFSSKGDRAYLKYMVGVQVYELVLDHIGILLDGE